MKFGTDIQQWKWLKSMYIYGYRRNVYMVLTDCWSGPYDVIAAIEPNLVISFSQLK